MSKRNLFMLLLTLLLVVVAVLILFGLHAMTAERIEHNQNAWLDAQLKTLVPPALYDNDLLADQISVVAPEDLGTQQPVSVYRARKAGMPTAAVIRSVAPDGYGGPINLLVAIRENGEVLGVHILAHHETPGIGDAFEQPGSTWADAFIGRSLDNTPNQGWSVRKDGGEFAQFTSATITPRAIVKAVQRTLDYYQRHRDQVFNTASVKGAP